MFSAHNVAVHIINWCHQNKIPITTVNKSMTDKFLETVQGKNGREAFQSLDEFINEHLIDKNRLAISVSKYENEVNKCKLERLKQEFCEFDSLDFSKN